jgi:hypothetical protein
MARPAGLEPATIRLEGGCSIQLSYGRLSICRCRFKAFGFGKKLCRFNLYRLTQRLAVLDKRGECYRAVFWSSTGKFKKYQLFKGVTLKAWHPPLPRSMAMREYSLFFLYFLYG